MSAKTSATTESRRSLTDLQLGLLATRVTALGISTRLTGVFRQSGVTYVGEAVQCTVAELLQLDNCGRRSILELETVLKPYGLRLGMQLPEWSIKTRHEWKRAYGDLARECLGRSLIEKEHRVEAADVGSRLRALALSLCGQRNGDIVIRLLGWGGQPPQTLESVGQEFGLTRERIRQLRTKFARSLKSREARPAWLTGVSKVLVDQCPFRIAAAETQLKAHGVELGGMDVRGLLTAFELFACEAELVCPGSGAMKGFMALAHHEESARRTISEARRLTSRQGCFELQALVEWAERAFDIKDAADFVRDLIDQHPSTAWLGDSHAWGWVPEVPRSRLFRPIRQVLTVTETISVEDLRSAIRRDLRMGGFAPPIEVLRTLVGHLPWCCIENELVRRRGDAAEAPLSGNARVIVDVLRGNGGAMSRHHLVEECARAGMNVSSCMLLIVHSATVVPVTPSVFALVGTEVYPSDIDRLTPRSDRGRVLQDYGRTRDGRPWVAVRASQSVITNGLLNIPTALVAYLQGEFILAESNDPEGVDEEDVSVDQQWRIRVNHQVVTGLRDPLRARAADLGDTVLVVFDAIGRTAELFVGAQSILFPYVESS